MQGRYERPGSAGWQERFHTLLEDLRPELQVAYETMDTGMMRDHVENALIVSMMMAVEDPVKQHQLAHIFNKQHSIMMQFGLTMASLGYAMALREQREDRDDH